MNGLECVMLEGVFYVYLSCVGIFGKKMLFGVIIEIDEDFVCEFLEVEVVVVVYGVVFGLLLFFRIFYVIFMEVLEEVCVWI